MAALGEISQGSSLFLDISWRAGHCGPQRQGHGNCSLRKGGCLLYVPEEDALSELDMMDEIATEMTELVLS